MGLSSFFKRAPAAEAGRRQSPPQDPGAVETLRTRARRRLIGVAVLVGGAVVGLPRLFDAPPRPADQPVAVHVAGQDRVTSVNPVRPEPIVTPGAPVVPAQAGASAAALMPGAARPMAALPSSPVPRAVSRDDGIITESKSDAQAEALAAQRRREQERKAQLERERQEKAQKAARLEKERAEKERAEKEKAERQRLEREKEREKERAAAKAEKARQERLEQQRAEKAREAEKDKAREAERQRARREAERRDKERNDKADKGHRYVVQVGSYSETRAVREARQRVDRIGLESFEQHVETSSGARTRVRLGPFATKEEATRAAAKLKAAGMNAAVLPL
jgi:DedD protein